MTIGTLKKFLWQAWFKPLLRSAWNRFSNAMIYAGPRVRSGFLFCTLFCIQYKPCFAALVVKNISKYKTQS